MAHLPNSLVQRTRALEDASAVMQVASRLCRDFVEFAFVTPTMFRGAVVRINSIVRSAQLQMSARATLI